MSDNEYTESAQAPSRWKVLPRLALMVAPLPKNTFCSIDVTAKCNLRCEHCYHFSHEQSKAPELSVEQWIERIEAMQTRKPFYSCTWVGGEPLLRPELIERGKRYFRSNRVVTNGTLSLPDWPDVAFHVSVDGTEPRHDAIRGEGCYSKIKKNLETPRYQRLNIVIACCINRENHDCIEDLIREWQKEPHVRHILFDFFTPIRGSKENLWLTFEERDAAIDELNCLRKKYGDFIGAPRDTFNLMKSDRAHKSVGKNCVFAGHGVAFDAWGNQKNPCVMGPKADCARCGCIVPFSLRAWKRPGNLLREILQGSKK